MTNRQPAGTLGATANHKGGTFAARAATEPLPGSLNTPLPESYSSLGLKGVLRKAEGDQIQHLHEVDHVFTSAGGREIFAGIDDEWIPTAVIRTDRTGAAGLVAGSDELGEAEVVQSALRRAILHESVCKVFPGHSNIIVATNPEGDLQELHAFLPTRAGYMGLEHNLDTSTTQVLNHETYPYAPVEGEHLEALLEELTGVAGENLEDLMNRVRSTMAADPDADPKFIAAVAPAEPRTL